MGKTVDRERLRERIVEAKSRAAELSRRIVELKRSKGTGTLGDHAAGLSSAPTSQLANITLTRVMRGHAGKMFGISWSGIGDPGGPALLTSVAQDCNLLVWNTLTQNKVDGARTPTSFIMCCAMEQTLGDLVAAGGLHNVIHVFKRRRAPNEPMSLSTDLTGHEGYVAALIFPTPDTAITASGDSTVRVWDVERETERAILHGHGVRGRSGEAYEGGDVMTVDRSPSNSNLLISGSIDCTAKVWDVRTHRAVMTFATHTEDVNSVAFLPDGQAFITGSDDAECHLHDMRAAAQLNTYATHQILSHVTSTAVSKSGRLLISGYDDGKLCAWDTLAYHPDAPLQHLAPPERAEVRQSMRVSCAAFNCTGQALATGSWDPSLLVWA